MILSALLASALAPICPVAPAPIQKAELETLHMVRIELGVQGQDLDDLAALGLDLSHAQFETSGEGASGYRSTQLVLDGHQMNNLRQNGWETQIIIEDLQSHYAERLTNNTQALGPPTYGAWLNPAFASGAMSGYYGYNEIGPILDQIHNAYPNIVGNKSSIGQSIQGRDIWVIKVSDNPDVDETEPEVRFDSLHHAREPQGMQTELWFLLWLVEEYGSDPLATYLVDEREIYFIPCVNPDGYAYNQQIAPQGGGLWRKNRRNNAGSSIGVDLNRNYPYQWGFDDLGSSTDPNSEVYRGTSAASEPEVQAMDAFISSRNFNTVLTLHCFSDLWLAPLGYIAANPANQAQYDEVGALATEFNGYPYGSAALLLYPANGTTLDYDHGVHGSLAWTPELGNANDGFWPATNRIVPIAEQNRIALARTALAAGPYLHVESVSLAELAGDGDGSYEGGESISVNAQVRNSGMLATAAVQVQLTSLSSELEVLNGSATIGALGSLSTGSAGSLPSLRILPGTPVGNYAYEVSVSSGGLQEFFFGEVTVGSDLILHTFDFEASGNQGWSVGFPDDASTGNWVRLNPIGTEAQTEDDHTPGGGNNTCWVTGQGSTGGSIGENDVDNGTTSLLSPIFDLNGLGNVQVNYWRWYSTHFSSGSPDDTFEIDLSNDGGANWTLAESLGPQGIGTTGGWAQATLIPGDVLPLTSQMRLRFRASDLNAGSIVEAAIDDLTISVLQAGDCPAPEAYCIMTPNSVGPGSTISSTGSTGVMDSNFALHADGIPANNFGLFFYGAGQNATPLGEGTLCVAPPFTRFTPVQANAAGQVTQALSLGAPFLPGSTWDFQFWYRDPAGGPAGFNLSNGLNVMFCN